MRSVTSVSFVQRGTAVLLLALSGCSGPATQGTDGGGGDLATSSSTTDGGKTGNGDMPPAMGDMPLHPLDDLPLVNVTDGPTVSDLPITPDLPASLSAGCDQLATALCTKASTCAPFFFQSQFADMASCISSESASCGYATGAPGTGWSTAVLSTCTAGLNAVACGDLLANFLPVSCRPTGTLADGTACGDDAQCTGGHCHKQGRCGTCAPAPVEGDPCQSNSDCPYAMGCANRQCHPYVAIGMSCDNQYKQCAPTASCVGAKNNTPGTCAAVLGAGAACDPTMATTAGCDNQHGLFCSPAKVCQIAATATPGQACGNVGGGTACVAGGYCRTAGNSGVGTCLAPAAVGALCDQDQGPRCAGFADCIGGVCVLGDPTDCTTAATICTAAVTTLCNLSMTCSPYDFEQSYAQLSDCVADKLGGCESSLTAPGVAADILPQVQGCAAALTGLSCADAEGSHLPAACLAPPGLIPNGSACSNSNECQSTFCSMANGGCGVCAALPVAGASCNNSCGDNSALSCVDYVCVIPGTLGQQCSDTQPCGSSLFCQGSSLGTSGTCVAELAAGAACDPALATTPPCDSRQGLYCDGGTKVCASTTLAAPGGACGQVNGAYVGCKAGGFCRTPSGSNAGTCLAPAAAGQSCDQQSGPSCLRPAYCMNGTCTVSGPSICGPVQPMQSCNDVAGNFCRQYDNCSSYELQTNFGDEQSCQNQVLASCNAKLTLDGSTWTAQDVELCALAIGGAACADVLDGALPPACTPTAGSYGNGTGCGDGAQCQSGFCLTDASGCGRCAQRPVVGAQCGSDDQCGDPAMYCANGQCQLLTTFGQPCDAGHQCQRALSCQGSSTGGTGVCRASLAAPGTTCDPQQITSPGCDGTRGLECDATSSTCLSIQVNGINQPCGNFNGSNVVCGADGYCQYGDGGTSGRCQQRVAPNGSCNPTQGNQCAQGGRCVNGTCVQLNPATCPK